MSIYLHLPRHVMNRCIVCSQILSREYVYGWVENMFVSFCMNHAEHCEKCDTMVCLHTAGRHMHIKHQYHDPSV